MKHTPTLFILFLALAAVIVGCEPADDGTMMDGTEAATFTFTGDFDGPLGLQLWSIQDSLREDIPGTLAEVRAMGFQEVELAGTYGLSPEQFRQALDRAGLDATAMHVSYDLLRDSLDAVLDDAETLGAEYVGVAWIPHEAPFTVATARQAAADFNEWGQAVSDRGLQFFYHIHGYEFQPDGGSIPFDVLMEETDPDHVHYEIDVFWAVRPGQDPAALLRQYPDRWALMHVKDMREGTATNDHSGGATEEDNVPVGTGQIDYAAVLQAAEEIGLDRYYIEDESPNPFGNIPQSIAYLESVTYE